MLRMSLPKGLQDGVPLRTGTRTSLAAVLRDAFKDTGYVVVVSSASWKDMGGDRSDVRLHFVLQAILDDGQSASLLSKTIVDAFVAPTFGDAFCGHFNAAMGKYGYNALYVAGVDAWSCTFADAGHQTIRDCSEQEHDGPSNQEPVPLGSSTTVGLAPAALDPARDHQLDSSSSSVAPPNGGASGADLDDSSFEAYAMVLASIVVLWGCFLFVRQCCRARVEKREASPRSSGRAPPQCNPVFGKQTAWPESTTGPDADPFVGRNQASMGNAGGGGRPSSQGLRLAAQAPACPEALAVEQRLRGNMDMPLAARRKLIKELLLKYHPDKNSAAHAREVFQTVNSARAWFLIDLGGPHVSLASAAS